MTFTDDDLKRLKENGCTCPNHLQFNKHVCPCPANSSALLARLEAAEYCVNKLADLNGFLDKPIYDREGHVVSITNLINNWRKAAGK